MALDKKQLASDLETIFTEFPPSADEAGKKWAEAYDAYANTGSTSTSKTTIVNSTAKVTPLANACATAFSGEGATAQSTGTAIESALALYWAAMPTSDSAGAFAGIAAAPTVAGKLSKAFSDNQDESNSAEASANKIADAFDEITKSVLVTVTNTSSNAVTTETWS